MKTPLNFAYKKATQALNYFAIRNGGRIDKLRVLKLLFFADRYHLRKYGRLITNDEYWAMEYGPVPSGSKDIAGQSEFLGLREKKYSVQYLLPWRTHFIKSKQPVDTEVFSESDREALAFAWRRFSRKRDLVQVTHMYPEWRKHERSLATTSRVTIDITDFLENPPAGVEECYHLTKDEKAIRRDQLREMSYVEALWS